MFQDNDVFFNFWLWNLWCFHVLLKRKQLIVFV